jgi:hypothetical protein
MKKLRAWMVRLGGLLPNQQRERELADEIESHLQLHIEDNLRLGMTEEQARRSALLQLGGVESTKENYRERSTVPFVEHTLQDVRFAVRQLRKSAGFNFAAIFMLRRSAASLPRPGDDWNPDTDVPVVSRSMSKTMPKAFRPTQWTSCGRWHFSTRYSLEGSHVDRRPQRHMELKRDPEPPLDLHYRRRARNPRPEFRGLPLAKGV